MRKFKVGEEVTVRTFEDMKKQYGVKNFAPELSKDSLFGFLLNEILSIEIISTLKRAILDSMKPFCGRKMRISANPEPDIYKLDGAELFVWPAEAFEEFWKEEEEPESTEVEENKQERKDMPKLENGMVVELRSGKRFLVAEFFGEQFLLSNECCRYINDMNFKTEKRSFDSTFDIAKVIKPYFISSLKCLKQSDHIIWEAE